MVRKVSKEIGCPEVEELLLLTLEERTPDQQAAIDLHLSSCPSCYTVFSQNLALERMLSERPVAAPSLFVLSTCRDALQDGLDRVRPVGKGRPRWWLRKLSPGSWVLVHPTWSTAVLILVGAFVGYNAPQWLAPPEPPNDQVFVVSPDFDVRSSNVSDIRMLSSVLHNTQRFEPGVRLEAVEALHRHRDDPQALEALVFAVRHDGNTGVRLKALEALRGREEDEQVRLALLDAVMDDPNEGVRVEAMNTLRALAESSQGVPFNDQRMVQVFRQLMRQDPNNYIRVQSALAIRQIAMADNR